jgi:hypothetical protein
MAVLRRLPEERYSEICREWVGKVTVLIGGGASLNAVQIARVRDARARDVVRVIAINDSYLWAPWADVCYFADSHWWAWHYCGVPKPHLGLTSTDVRDAFATFLGQKCSIQNSGGNVKDDDVHLLRNLTYPNHSSVLSINPRFLATGRNSGYQALNFAVLAGAMDIVLLAFDGVPGHWHGGHPVRPGLADGDAPGTYIAFRRAFSEVEGALEKLGVRVVNCSPGTQINAFKKAPLEEVLR